MADTATAAKQGQCESCDMLQATLVIKASGRRVCGLCAPRDGRKVRLLMVSEVDRG